MSPTRFRHSIALLLFVFSSLTLSSQIQSVQLGMGNNDGIIVTESHSVSQSSSGSSTVAQGGFLPNLNAASRFLSQATLGYNIESIENVAEIGIEDWIDAEF